MADGSFRSSSAYISDCGQYRYWLTRSWDPTLPALLWVMLNPSTADAAVDDATIRKVIRFATKLGYGGICVVNLFAFRATDPKHMKSAVDPVGTLNDDVLRDHFARHNHVICAWGAHGTFQNRDAVVLQLMKEHGVIPLCLALSKTGQPKHPLYLSEKLTPVAF